MKFRTDIKDNRTVLTLDDEVKVFFRMNDERDYRAHFLVDGKEYYFSALSTDCPFATVSLLLHENTNKRTVFTLIIEFSRIVDVRPLD